MPSRSRASVRQAWVDRIDRFQQSGQSVAKFCSAECILECSPLSGCRSQPNELAAVSAIDYQGALTRPFALAILPRWGSAPVGVQRLRARYSYSAIPTRMLRWGSAWRLKRDLSVSVRSIRVRFVSALS